MSTIILAAGKSFDLPVLKQRFAEFNIEAFPLALTPRPKTLPEGGANSAFAVLLSTDEGVVDVGEEVGHLRRLLGGDRQLIACTHRRVGAERRLLREQGADEIVAPRAWTVQAIIERVAGALLYHGLLGETEMGLFRGGTPPMRRIFNEIRKIAPFKDEPVLILGETGTGKELAANEIHRLSGRAGELIAVNMAALSKELTASELFGHKKGAFTDAVTSRRGLLAKAGDGTAFLDEIGDLDLSSQAKLLRVLEEQKVRPVGSDSWEEIQARIILATNRNLLEDCAKGRFRRDLYERIRGFTLRLPPLRDRRADIPVLAEHFLDQFNRKYPGTRHLPAEALDLLFPYDWPGNVRELRQLIRNAAVFADDPRGAISIARIHEAVLGTDRAEEGLKLRFNPAVETWDEVHSRIQEQYFESLVMITGGNKARAAELSGYRKSRFYAILKEIQERRSERCESEAGQREQVDLD